MEKQKYRHKAFMSNALTKQTELKKCLDRYDFDPHDEVTQPIAAWMVKTYELVYSMFELSETNSEIGMIVLCRSVMEYCLFAKYLSLHNEEGYKRWLLTELRSEIATQERKNGSFYSLIELRKEQEQLESEGYRKLRFSHVLDEIGEPELITAYDWLSKYSHGRLGTMFDDVYKKRGNDTHYSLVVFAEPNSRYKKILWEGTALFLKHGIEALVSRERHVIVNNSR